MSNHRSEEKKLRALSFVVHATRGVIRDQKARRRTMFVLLVAALVLLLAGSTLLQAPLNPREHPLGFLLFWIACGWLTLTALLLAFFDVLLVKLGARRTKRALRDNLEKKNATSNAQ